MRLLPEWSEFSVSIQNGVNAPFFSAPLSVSPTPRVSSIGTLMRIDLIPAGDDVPNTLNVLIEVPIGGEPVKYEIDKASGALFVDRILHTSMRYPANYGFIPHTLGEDGDPLDALVIARSPIVPGAVIRVRPVGVLLMDDDKGGDEKLITVPVDTTFPYYSEVNSHDDLPPIVTQQIEHFFQHYKDLEPGKWAKLKGWGGVDEAKRIIIDCIERAKAHGL